MSYSFRVIAQNKQDAKDQIFTKLSEICETQPSHKVDSEKTFAAVSAFIDTLSDDQNKNVSCSVSGSVVWVGNWSEEAVYTSSTFGINAYLVDKA